MLDTRTLVLDDDGLSVDVLARCLRNTVRLVDRAVDGEQALALFAAHRHSVVVLEDVVACLLHVELERPGQQ